MKLSATDADNWQEISPSVVYPFYIISPVKIRRTFIRNIMKTEAAVVPEVINYCLNAVQKDEKCGYSDVFFGLREHLKLEKLRVSRSDTGL